MIIGTPVVATDCTGVSEWLDNGKFGMILENSVEGIFNGLNEIVKHPETINQYRQRIPEKQKMISFENSLREIEGIFLE